MSTSKATPPVMAAATPAAPSTQRLLNWLRRQDELLFAGLVFSFFFLAPFPFLSGYSADKNLLFTLYDLPKYVFICPAALLLSTCFVFSLSYNQARRERAGRFLRHNLGIRLLLLLFGLQALSLTAAVIRQNAFLQLVINFIFLLLFVVLAVLFQEEKIFRASILGTVLSLLVFCPLGILQFFGIQLPFLLPIRGPAATLGYRNPAAHYLAVNLPFAVFLTFSLARKAEGKNRPGGGRFAAVFLFGLIAAMASVHLFMTTTRTAILAFMLYSFLVPFYFLAANWSSASPKLWLKTLAMVVMLALVTGGSLLAFPGSRARVMQSVTKLGSLSVLEARRYHWGNTLYMIKDHPWRGVGLGNWQFTYPLYMKSYRRDTCFSFKVQVRKTHNDYLQLAAECGLGALVVFLCLWGRQFFLLWRRQLPPANQGFNYALFCSLLGFSVIMLFSFPLQLAYSRLFFFYLLALGESSARA